MELYNRIQTTLAALVTPSEWSSFHNVLEQAGAVHPPAWGLPLAACRAVGGTADQALPATAAVAAAHIAILLVDDLLDEDPRGRHHRLGAGGAANLAAAFQSTALQAAADCAAPKAARLDVLERLNHMFFSTAWGQYLDALNPADEAGYWQVAESKSSPFFAAAFYAGARLGGANHSHASALGDVGALYGVMVQVHDDLNDALETPANPDWLQGRHPLPLLYAATVDHPERKRFIALRAQAAKPEKLAAAQEILLRCGAVSYCLYHLRERHTLASQKLAALGLPSPEAIGDVLASLIRPVDALLKAAAT